MSGQEMERQLVMVRSGRVLLVIPPGVILSPKSVNPGLL